MTAPTSPPPAPARPAGSDFLSARFDGADWTSIEPVVGLLRDRRVASIDDLERWLLDRSEFDAACSEARANLYIAMTCDTGDEAAAGAWTRYIESVPPRLKPAAFDLDRRQVALSERFPLSPARYAVLERDTRVDVELFREENVPIETELELLDQQYDRVTGAMTVDFDGQERTLPQMSRFLEEPDRALRERAWRAVADRRLRDRDAIDEVFDAMIPRRHALARNADFTNYRDYIFRARRRFDYTPEHCAAFHDAIERVVCPLVRALDERRARTMRVSPLHPWDLSVDPRSRPPLRPFEGGAQLFEKCLAVFRRLDPQLASMFETLRDGGCLDLDTRKGKAPGGYQYMRDLARRPFIFMNAAGLQTDVRTMIHEAGHAFHSMLCVDEPLVAYRHSPIEFAEVASMSMELLTMPHWGEFHESEADLGRARREQLEGVVDLLPWIATIDAFQHWLYLSPAHSREQRTSAWLVIADRFARAVSWHGLGPQREALWQRQGHLFGQPFYYIEYGIAQLGALQLWLMSREQGPPAALAAYKRALSLGGSRPLPDLFGAAGLTFDFGPAVVERLARAVADELSTLPE